jgi:hypothetical protein
MKNIVYYAFDKHYLECFEYNLKALRESNPNIHVCCITPTKFDIDDVDFFITKPFDVRHTAKYQIVNWPHFEEYDNFLYLDSDAIPTKSLDPIFNEINETKNFIHGVTEFKNFSSLSPWFRVFPYEAAEGPAYNAGTFGFNKIQKPIIQELLSFIKRVKPITICEQPCFNEFLACQKKILTPSLSKYVYLRGVFDNNKYSHINTITLSESSIVHFLGGFSCPPLYMEKKIEGIVEVLKLSQNN